MKYIAATTTTTTTTNTFAIIVSITYVKCILNNNLKGKKHLV
jgi:hypothetical protein